MSHETQAKLQSGLEPGGMAEHGHGHGGATSAEWAAKSAMSIGQLHFKTGRYDEAILVYDAGLRVLGARPTPLWAELLGMRSY